MKSKQRKSEGSVVATGRRARFQGFGATFFVLILLCGLAVQLHAKVDAGISGIVTDASGAVLAGATVQAKSVETGIVQKRETNADGFYAFVDLQPGHYDVEASQAGFTTYRQTAILLDVNSAKVLDIKLTVGQISEKVEVVSDAVQLDTASTQNGEVIRAQIITALPLVT